MKVSTRSNLDAESPQQQRDRAIVVYAKPTAVNAPRSDARASSGSLEHTTLAKRITPASLLILGLILLFAAWAIRPSVTLFCFGHSNCNAAAPR